MMMFEQARQQFASRKPATRRLWLVSSLVVLLTACAGKPTAVLAPVAETAPGATQINMLVATTRMRSDNPGEMFTGERALAPSFADITVSIPPSSVRKPGEVAWPKKLPPNPATDFAVTSATVGDAAQAKAWLATNVRRSPDRSVLVFVHGFNNRFEDAVFRFAQIAYDSGTKSVPILVTWPSRGKLLAYGYDRESTNYSRNALEQLFQYLAADNQVQEVSILAHSMGNWLALESLRQMAIRNGGLPKKFKNVMLASPDVDVDVFRSQIADMGNPRPNMTLFVSRDDRALATSKRVWGDIARLGAINPDEAPYKKEMLDNNITVYDLTAVKSSDDLNHSKFAESPEIVQLIGRRLSDGQALAENTTGIGELILNVTAGAAQAVGTGVAIAATAPIAIVDPNTRANLSEHVEQSLGTIGEAGSRASGKAGTCISKSSEEDTCKK